MNKVILIGNLGKEIEIKKFEGGSCVGNVSLATSYQYKNKQGEKITKTSWHNLVFRNKSAEAIEKYTKKGSQIAIEGMLDTRFWEKDKQKYYVTEVLVDTFMFLDKKDSNVKS